MKTPKMWKGACVFWWVCGFTIFGPHGENEKWWIPLIYGAGAIALTGFQLHVDYKERLKRRNRRKRQRINRKLATSKQEVAETKF